MKETVAKIVGLLWEEKAPWLSRASACNVQFQPKDKYEVALQQLPRNFGINFEARMA